MIADLLLPCVSFEIIVYPSDPDRATDLEAAALFFVRDFEDVGGAPATKLDAFLGLGDAVFQDMLIRMINRGWVKIQPRSRRLSLSNEARAVLDRAAEQPASQSALAMRSTEEGRRVCVCYDLLGGGFAIINRRFLLRSRDDAFTVPTIANADELDCAPFGLALDGFALPEPPEKEGYRGSRNTEILRALQADKGLRKSLFGMRNGAAPHIHVLPPARKLTFDDVQYYKCRFDVRVAQFTPEPSEGAPNQTWSENIDLETEAVPELSCVEQRNISIRRIGEQNADQIIELAIKAAANPGGDARFLKVLRRHAEEVRSIRIVSPDPLRSLKDRLTGKEVWPLGTGQDEILEDLLEFWGLALDRIEMLLASRLDFSVSRPIDVPTHSEALFELLSTARELIVVSSPQMRQRSPELTAGRTVFGTLADLATSQSGVKILVHGVRGETQRGATLSDAQAIERLVTALGVDQVHVVDRALDHMRTPFVLADDDCFLWQGQSTFGDRPLHGLLVRLLNSGANGSLSRLERSLPPGLRERVLAGRNPSTVQRPILGESWPADVAASVRDINATLVHATAGDLSDPIKREKLAESIGGQIDFLTQWLLTSSDCVEPVMGAQINEKANELLGPSSDHASLVIGISGWADSQALSDLLEALTHRLTRQDHANQRDALTVLCLPDSRGFDRYAAIFEKNFVQAADRFSLVRGRQAHNGAHPPGFIITPTSALLAQDGLVLYVPTAGRRVKGTHLGLQFMGTRARNLAANFLNLEWPEAEKFLNEQAIQVERPKRVPSLTRAEIVQNIARTERWFYDGNRGAGAAVAYMRASEGDAQSRWISHYGDALAWLESPEPEKKALGYALAKASAIAEDQAEIESIGALEALAVNALRTQNLLVTAVLADYLPKDSPYRDPLTRRLAYSLARREAPTMTIDEQARLASPTSAALCLASLLMMDGLGASLIAWLAVLSGESITSPEGALAQSLATHLRATGTRVVDLGHVASDRSKLHLSVTVEGLRQLIIAARTRQDVGLVEQVHHLRRIIYERPGSFVVELLNVIEQVPGASEAELTQRLLTFFSAAEKEIGCNLCAAGEAAVNVNRLAEDYFQRKNHQMGQETGLEPVRIDRGGRNLLTSLKKIFNWVLYELVPKLRSNASQAEQELGEIARNFLRSQDPSGSELAVLRGFVRNRLLNIHATAALSRAPWLFPTLHGVANKDWGTLRQAILMQEFVTGTKYHEVVGWFIEADRIAGGASLDKPGDVEPLLLLHDLLESFAGHIETQDEDTAHEALDRRLTEIAREAGDTIQAAEGFTAEVDEVSDPLVLAIRSAADEQSLLLAHLREHDLSSAVIRANDMRRKELTVMRDLWIEASKHELAALRGTLEAELAGLGASFRNAALSAAVLTPRLPIQRATLVRARSYVRLARWLSVPITFNEDLRLEIGEGRRPAVELGATADLVDLLAAARRGEPLVQQHDNVQPTTVVSMIVGYFSNLPEHSQLAKAERDDRVWRVSCTHPYMTALSFGASRQVDFLLPLNRNAELNLRGKASKLAAEVLPISMGGHIVKSRPRSSVDTRTVPHEILLSLFISDFLPERAVLLWRHLAQAASLPESQRRIASLSALAQQRFVSMDVLWRWWKDLASERERLIPALLNEDIDERFPEIDLARHIRNLCLSLGVFVSRSNAGLMLSADGIVAAAANWPRGLGEPEEGQRFTLSDVTAIFEKVLEAATHTTRA